MSVRLLSLRNVRSYEQLEFRPGLGLVVLAGPNGVGKTNLLEALSLVFLGASPRTSAEMRLVREGKSFARVSATFDVSGSPHQRVVVLQPGRGKQLRTDDVTETNLESFSHDFPAVVFLPERLLIVRGAPARRRAAVDRIVVRVMPTVASTMRHYVKAVTQRNAVLRRGRGGSDVRDALAPWTDQVVRLGEAVREARAETIALARQAFRRRFEELTSFPDGDLVLELRGRDIEHALQEQRDMDMRRGTTSAGPHLDDLHFLQGERDLRSFGSTGEQRAALLAWALAEADVITEAMGIEPLLLLDEPYAELDRDRRGRLTRALLGRQQVLVTANEPPHHVLALSAEGEAHVYEVSSGTVAPWTSAADIAN